jgi:hypothetical protein
MKDSLRLNAMGDTILSGIRPDYEPLLELSAYSQNSQKRKKKEAKKKEKRLLLYFNQKRTFLSCTKQDISKLRRQNGYYALDT